MAQKNKKTISFSVVNKWMLICNIILFASFLSIQIGITSVIGTKSSEIEFIRREKDSVRLEIEILQSEIDEAKSFDNFEEVIEAQSLQQKSIIYIDDNISNEVAQR